MKILVNAVTCRVAGGRAVALNFLRCYRDGDFPHELVAYVPRGCGFEGLSGGRVLVKSVSPFANKPWARLWIDNVWSRRVLCGEAPDVLFAMGSTAYPTSCPQLVLYHWPYAIYPEPEAWEHMSARHRLSRRGRRWLFARRIPYASHFAAQTETARRRLEQQWGLRNVSVVPNAVSVDLGVDVPEADALPPGVRRAGRRVLLCLTRYYPHKNLEVLLELGRRLRDTSAPFAVVLTVSPEEGREVVSLLRKIRREGLEDVLVNLGTVPMERVPALHRACDGLLLPTMLESFSGTYVESMHFGRPVFTSDRDFARDVCGDAAFYFDPRSADDILSVLRRAFAEPAEIERRVEEARKRCQGFPSWPEVTARYVALLEAVARRPAA